MAVSILRGEVTDTKDGEGRIEESAYSGHFKFFICLEGVETYIFLVSPSYQNIVYFWPVYAAH